MHSIGNCSASSYQCVLNVPKNIAISSIVPTFSTENVKLLNIPKRLWLQASLAS